MAMKKITGVAEIDAIANSLSKKFGGKEVISLDQRLQKQHHLVVEVYL